MVGQHLQVVANDRCRYGEYLQGVGIQLVKGLYVTSVLGGLHANDGFALSEHGLLGRIEEF